MAWEAMKLQYWENVWAWKLTEVMQANLDEFANLITNVKIVNSTEKPPEEWDDDYPEKSSVCPNCGGTWVVDGKTCWCWTF